MKIPVVHILKGLGRGGAEILLLETLKLHNTSRFEFSYVFYYSKKNALVSELEKAGGKVFCLNQNSTIAVILSLWKTYKQIRKISPSLIHAHMPVTGFVARIVGRMLKVPVIYTEHYNLNKYGFLTVRLNKLNYGWNNTVIAVSDEAAIAIRQTTHFRGSLKTVLNAVNTEHFNRTEIKSLTRSLTVAKQLEGKIVVGTIAVFRRQKQLDIWLKIAAHVLTQNKNFRFLIIGDGPESELLKSLVKQLGVEQFVLFTGLVSNTRDYLGLIDIYLMTSFFEGLPVALLEAMSMQCVPVVTPVGGIPDLIDDNTNGYFIDSMDIDGSATKILSIGSNDQKLMETGVNARQTVIDKYSMYQMVNDLEEIYRTVLDDE